MREYLLVAATVATVCVLLTPLVRRVAISAGVWSPIRDRDVHDTPIPRMGGLAMFLAVLAGFLVASRLPTLGYVFTQSRVQVAVAEAGLVLVVLGMLDDRFGLDPLSKLAGQVVAAGILVLNGVQILYLPDPFHPHSVYSLGGAYGVPVTAVLVVAVINAVNFVDGLDGLAAGVVGIAATALLVYSWQLAVVHRLERATPPTLVAAILAGACAGFLLHNFHPATIFMGDTGSMLIGMMLAAATIGVTGQIDPSAIGNSVELFPVLLPLLLPLAVLAVPFLDLLLAVIRRTRARRSPFAPDKQHLHHRLMEIGHSQRRAVLIMYLWTALVAGTAVYVALAPRYDAAALAVVLVLVGVAVVFSAVPRLRHRVGS